MAKIDIEKEIEKEDGRIFVIKRNMADDSQNVCNNAKLEHITEMSIGMELFHFWV